MEIVFKIGSNYESKEKMGLSHFLEHMFSKGTKKRPTPLDITGPIENVGGVLNAFTSQDLTGYYIKVDAAHLNLALDIVADIFLNSLLHCPSLHHIPVLLASI